MSFLRNALSPKKQDPFPPGVQAGYKYKTRFALIGTVGAGKSSVAAGLVLTAETLSAVYPNFYCRVLENTTSIISDANNLRAGRFPKKTSPYMTYPPESGIMVNFGSRFGDKKVQVPIADVAGEDIQQMINTVRNTNALSGEAYQANMNLINYVKDADGFILVMPATESISFRDDASIKREVGMADADSNLHRILSTVIQHKEVSQGKKVKGIGVFITKWDLISAKLQNLGIDLYEMTERGPRPSMQGMRNFMDLSFPATSMLLKASNVDNIRVFPSHFTVEHDDMGNLVSWPDGSGYRIKVPNRKDGQYRIVPDNSEQSYIDAFEWLRGFAS